MAALRLIQLNEVANKLSNRSLKTRYRVVEESGRAMPVLDAHSERRPGAEEIRAALGRMAESEAFRGSPQLIAFLHYVVEATLRGEQDRIKGYTIAIEALGRSDDFDPQSDPIVRVEATRLRRAIHRYYDNGGKHDPVQIDLPLGSYVPAFHRVAPTVVPLPTVPPRRRRFEQWRNADWRNLVAGGLLIAFGASLYGGLDLIFDFNTPNPHATALLVPAPSRAAPAAPGGPAYPAVYVGAFQSIGKGAAGAPADSLREKVRDALARFDAIHVMTEAPSREHYRLTASAEYDEAGMTALTARLVDTADGSVTYSKTFSRDNRDGSEDDSVRDQDAVAREISAALAQPYGIIQAHERAKGSDAGEPQYRCLIETYDYWRSYDPQQHRQARDCLERAIEATPGFALGYAALAPIIAEEHRAGVNVRPGDAPPLQRALAAARRAVQLKPGSARAHLALADVQFTRGDYPLALETAERAVMLNPYDPSIVAYYGAMLVSLGEQERGAKIIRHAANVILVRPVRQDFFLFLTAYLSGDAASATRHAAMITAETHPLGAIAHALVAAQRGDADLARHLLDRLAVMRPAWRRDMRGELQKYFPAEAIVDRLAQDLGRIATVSVE